MNVVIKMLDLPCHLGRFQCHTVKGKRGTKLKMLNKKLPLKQTYTI